MINVNQITSTLAKLPDQQLQQYAAMHKNDPYIMSLAMAESNRRKEMRAAAQGGQGPQGQQPTVVDQEIASMAAPMPEDTGIAQLPAGDMDFADGGIVGYAGGGDLERQVSPATQRDRDAEAQQIVAREFAQAQERLQAAQASGDKEAIVRAQGDVAALQRELARFSSKGFNAPLAAAAPATAAQEDPSVLRLAPGIAAATAYGASKAMPAANAALQNYLGMSNVTVPQVAGAAARSVGKAVTPTLPSSTLGKAGVAGILGGTALDTANTSTEDYRKRFGMELGPGEDPSFLGDLGIRSLGAASDLANTLSFGYIGPKVFRDKQPEDPNRSQPLRDFVTPRAPKTPAAAPAPAATAPAKAPAEKPADVPAEVAKEAVALAKETVPAKQAKGFTGEDWLMLGLNLMATKSPRFLQAVGEAGVGALKSKQDREKAERDAAREAASDSVKERYTDAMIRHLDSQSNTPANQEWEALLKANKGDALAAAKALRESQGEKFNPYDAYAKYLQAFAGKDTLATPMQFGAFMAQFAPPKAVTAAPKGATVLRQP